MRVKAVLILLFSFVGVGAATAQSNADKLARIRSESAVQRTQAAYANTADCETGQAHADLDVNNVRARIYNTGGLFWKGSGNVYTVPKDGSADAIFASGIWIGGLVDDKLRFAGASYGPWEFWPGPLDSEGQPPADCAQYDRIFKISRADLEHFDATGETTEDLRDWPVELGAPMEDGDGNPDNYSLEGGDRPKLFGDQTLWWVMNDAAGPHQTSDSAPIGMEVQVTAYAHNTANALNNTTFYRYKLIYKGGAPLTDSYFGVWADVDIGDAADDFIGSDPERNMGFAYNGNAFDAGSDGYGKRPPALGYVFLQGPVVGGTEGEERLGMSTFLHLNGDRSHIWTPSHAGYYYGYLRGIWLDGTSISEGGNGFGGSVPTSYMYPGDPTTLS